MALNSQQALSPMGGSPLLSWGLGSSPTTLTWTGERTSNGRRDRDYKNRWNHICDLGLQGPGIKGHYHFIGPDQWGCHELSWEDLGGVWQTLGCRPLQCRFHHEGCGRHESGAPKLRSPPRPMLKGLRQSHWACKELQGSWLPAQGCHLARAQLQRGGAS